MQRADERLTGVVWKDAVGNTVDSKTYHYEDINYPSYVTGITDHRGMRVSTYAYDTAGRAVSTQGAAANDRFTVEYSDTDLQFTRRVTRPSAA